MVGGSIRFDLLCIPGGFHMSQASDDEDLPGLWMDTTPSDDIIQLSAEDVFDVTVPFVATSPSGEVLLSSTMTTTSISSAPTVDTGSTSSAPTVDTGSTSSAPTVVAVKSFSRHVTEAVEITLTEMKGCEDPATILRCYQQHLLRGRSLNAQSEDTYIEGETAEIFISRYSMFEDTVEEIVREDLDLSCPLNVQFIGEEALDLGGPRREFLRVNMRYVQDLLFQENAGGCSLKEDTTLTHTSNKHYYVTGLLMGLSLLQEGPPLNFISEDLLERIIDPISDQERQLSNGLANLGLMQLFHAKPAMLFLLRNREKTALMYPSLVRILKPIFAEEGSNIRHMQDEIYHLFLKYLKEVNAGRRGLVTLEKVLEFCTGASTEPIFGFTLHPSIAFQEDMPGLLPVSNTCINRLMLPFTRHFPPVSEMFVKFDYTFTSVHFGLV